MSHTTPGAGSETAANKKDRWNTSPQAFADAQALIGMPFTLDAAAEAKHAKCDDYITPEMDSLKTAWLAKLSGAVFCNPPFSKKTAFLTRALGQAKFNHVTSCIMIPFEPGTQWWRTHVSGKATFVYVPDGRYNFLDADTGEEIKGCPFVSCFVVFTPLTAPTQYVEFKRGIGFTDTKEPVNGDSHLQESIKYESSK